MTSKACAARAPRTTCAARTCMTALQGPPGPPRGHVNSAACRACIQLCRKGLQDHRDDRLGLGRLKMEYHFRLIGPRSLSVRRPLAHHLTPAVREGPDPCEREGLDPCEREGLDPCEHAFQAAGLLTSREASALLSFCDASLMRTNVVQAKPVARSCCPMPCGLAH